MSSPDAPDALQELTEEFWAWRSRQAPRTRDDITRLARPPGWLPAWSAGDVGRVREQLAGFERRLAALPIAPPAGRPPQTDGPTRGEAVARYVDARLLASALARVRFELDAVASWRRDAWFYLDQTIGTVFDALLTPPPFGEARVDELLGLLQSFGATLAAARENLAGCLADELARSALVVAPSAGRDLTEALDALAAHLGSPAGDAVGLAAVPAAAELDAFAAWLASESAVAQPLGAPGRAVLERYLYDVALVPRTPEELLDAGRRELERAVDFELFEQHRSPDASWPPLPASAQAQCEAERAAELTVRSFYEQHGLLTQPAHLRHYLNLPRPPWLTPLAWLGVTDDLTGPGRLDEDGISYVPPPAPDLPYFYRANAADPRAGIVHEGAHYQQLVLAWAHPRSARRHFYDSCPNEGIAFYNEEMLLQAGLFDEAPVTRRVIYSFLRLRALRVEVDLRLAQGEWSIAQGAEALASLVPMDRATAEQEAAFFAATPFQGSSYLTGKLELLGLLADARLARGDGFELRAFHDWVWRNGNVPFCLQRLELLGDASQLARVDTLRAGLGLDAPLVAPLAPLVAP